MSFTANEIFEIAVQIERNGVRFYEHVARVAADPACRDLLAELAEMEREHQETFEQAQAAVTAGAEMFDADAEMMPYIRAMADGHVFDVGVDPVQILTGSETSEEILSIAIGLEKESIVYYAALKETVTEPRTLKKLQDIILEEMAHVAQLSGQRESLK